MAPQVLFSEKEEAMPKKKHEAGNWVSRVWRAVQRRRKQEEAPPVPRVQDALWRKNYEAHLLSDKWYNFRQVVLRRACFQCEWIARTGRRCAKTKGLEVHHLHYRTFGDERPEDVQVLCHQHHTIADNRRAQKTERARERRVRQAAKKK